MITLILDAEDRQALNSLPMEVWLGAGPFGRVTAVAFCDLRIRNAQLRDALLDLIAVEEVAAKFGTHADYAAHRTAAVDKARAAITAPEHFFDDPISFDTSPKQDVREGDPK